MPRVRVPNSFDIFWDFYAVLRPIWGNMFNVMSHVSLNVRVIAPFTIYRICIAFYWLLYHLSSFTIYFDGGGAGVLYR